MSRKYDKQKFQQKILKLDPQCMVVGCLCLAVSGHHIIYKSKWSDALKNSLGFGRDSNQNGIGLCAEHHYKVHNGLGLNKISGREYMYEILDIYSKNTGYYYRWLKVKNELRKSIIRKGWVGRVGGKLDTHLTEEELVLFENKEGSKNE